MYGDGPGVAAGQEPLLLGSGLNVGGGGVEGGGVAGGVYAEVEDPAAGVFAGTGEGKRCRCAYAPLSEPMPARDITTDIVQINPLVLKDMDTVIPPFLYQGNKIAILVNMDIMPDEITPKVALITKPAHLGQDRISIRPSGHTE